MNDVMLREIQSQPGVLHENLPLFRSSASSEPLLSQTFKRLFITGCGDSFVAPFSLRHLYQEYLDIPVEVLPAMEASQYASFRPGDLLIGISVSGSVRRTVEAELSAHAAGARVLSISGNPASRLAQNSDATFTIPVRSLSRKTPHSVDYLVTLLALAVILEKMSGRRLDQLDLISGLVAKGLRESAESCSKGATHLAHSEHFYFLGAGPHWATAQYGAAKMWEAGGLLASAFELEEFAHGAHLMLKEGDAVIMIAPDGYSQRRAAEFVGGLGELGARVGVITDCSEQFRGFMTFPIPAIAEKWSPFTACLPLQLLCLGIANSLGLDVVSKIARVRNIDIFDRVQEIWTRETEEYPRMFVEKTK